MKAISVKTTIIKLFTAIWLILTLIAFFTSCQNAVSEIDITEESTKEAAIQKENVAFDIQKTLFIGDSNIYHLKSYGLLPADQILTGKECYMTLEPSVCDKYVVLQSSGKETKIADVISELKPEFIVITLGTDGAYSLDKDGFCLSYTQLLDVIIDSSPESIIGVQSIFPVCEGEKDVRFKDVDKTNQKFSVANQWLKEIAEEYKIVYFDTASVLSDADGKLKREFNTDHLDGYHLNREGLCKMLEYISKTH